MPGGPYDSSNTRVAPVFNSLTQLGPDWPRQLVSLVGFPSAPQSDPLDLTFLRGYWGDTEMGMDPPLSLLSWLIRNLTPPVGGSTIDERRQLLLAQDPATVQAALQELRTSARARAWNIFEGQTFPDALIETPDALIVVEGKRTEPGPTTSTTWMAGRHQIWRHIDAAWEVRGRRRVFGLFIVEADRADGRVPAKWTRAVEDALSRQALVQSFPHRGQTEVEQISRCLLGVTTWQQICASFGLRYGDLPDRVRDLPSTPLGTT